MKIMKALPVLLAVLTAAGCAPYATTPDDYWGKPTSQDYADIGFTVLFQYSRTACGRTLIGYSPRRPYEQRFEFVQTTREGQVGNHQFSPAEALKYAAQVRALVHTDRAAYESIILGPKNHDGKETRIYMGNQWANRDEIAHRLQIRDLTTLDHDMNDGCVLDARYYAGMAQAFENAARMDRQP